ncbi:MAG: 50S ribosomal protein L11 methyltransferase [Burkholderiaceae bacterium]
MPADDQPASNGSAGRWRESAVTVSRHDADRLSDALLEAGALSVQLEDADADTPDERAQFGEPGMPAPPVGWSRSRLLILAGHEADVGALLAQACAQTGLPVPPIDSQRLIDDQDWVTLTQAQFEPIPFGDRLLISPSWHAARPADADRLRIVLDPGLAFGTGSHPTTRMCLHWLEANLRVGDSVLDYGCGSGILGIAAALLGAGEVVGLDIDEGALQSAAENARNNGVSMQLLGSRDPRPQPARVVVANILASPLKVLAPLLEDLVQPGGSLVLAGLLDAQADEVAACYRRLPMRVYRQEEGWSCLAGMRSPDGWQCPEHAGPMV